MTLKRTFFLLVVMALAALMSVGGNVLASDDMETQEAVVEQGQVFVEEGQEIAEDSVMMNAEEVQDEAAQATEEQMEDGEEAAPQADK